MGFDSLLGNEEIKTILSESAKNGNILNSYLFFGTEGIGKKCFALEFAKQILCLSNNKPCNSCKSCIEFSSNNNPDFFIIEPDGTSIKIDQIRAMQKKIIEKPINSTKKVYIINDANLMTKEAQNCLLKTLEEPPEYIIIILIASDENKLLTTIKSRCLKIFFQKLSNKEIKRFVDGKNCDVQLNENMLELCEGSITRALKIIEKSEILNAIEILIEQIDIMNELELINYSQFFYDNKDDIDLLLSYMYLLLFKRIKSTNNLKYINAMEEVQKAKNKLSNSNNYDMTIDNMLINMGGI